jgi:NADH dehydrogenase
MQSFQPQKILILGGSGFVGQHVCSRLSLQHHHVTVPTRRLPARNIQMMPGISVVQADVHDPKQLQALVHGHDVVINLIAILHGTEDEFNRVHVTLPTQLARA